MYECFLVCRSPVLYICVHAIYTYIPYYVYMHHICVSNTYIVHTIYMFISHIRTHHIYRDMKGFWTNVENILSNGMSEWVRKFIPGNADAVSDRPGQPKPRRTRRPKPQTEFCRMTNIVMTNQKKEQ